MDALPDHDPIRTAYDAWIADIDPRGEMDDYQRGRLWLHDDPAGMVAAADLECRVRAAGMQ